MITTKLERRTAKRERHKKRAIQKSERKLSRKIAEVFLKYLPHIVDNVCRPSMIDLLKKCELQKKEVLR